jgi:hypothetical protein
MASEWPKTSQGCLGTSQGWLGTSQGCLGTSQGWLGTSQGWLGTSQGWLGTSQGWLGTSQGCLGTSQGWLGTSYLIYLRTIHYFIHLNSSNTFVILLPSSYLALAFCPCISLLCCNHATRNNFCSSRLIHFRTIHSLYPHQEPPRGLPGLVNAIGSLPAQCRR